MEDENDNQDPQEDGEGEQPQADPLKDLEARFNQRFTEQDTAHQNSLHQMGLKYAELEGRYNAVVANQQAGNTKAEPELVDVSDDEIEAAMEAGDFKKAIALQKKQARIEAKRETAILRETEIRPLQGTVNGVGLPAMANLTQHVVASQLPPEAQEFYQKNREAIHKHMAAMPQEALVDPNAIRGAIAYELGMQQLNGGLSKSIDDEVERRIRQGNQPGGLKIGTNGQRTTGGAAIDYSKIFGEAAGAAVEDKGGFDGFAQKLGYEDMADYCKKNGVVIQ